MAYLCCFTDLNNQISFDVSDLPINNNDGKYLEFAKYVSNPHEKQAIISMLNAYSLSDVYMIFSLMDGELWTPYGPPTTPVLQRHDAISGQSEQGGQSVVSVVTELSDNLIFETIEEEPEISDPD
jgi:hypothetical protein